MSTRTSDKTAQMRLRFCALVVGLLVPLSVHAAVDRPASIEASGEGAIFDVKATAGGTLRICTKPGRAGDRWRATIAQSTTAGGVSGIGSGSMTAFSGCVSQTVVANVPYLVLVTWDRPLPGTFPASVTVHFTGPTDADNPPVVQLNGGALTSIIPRPIRWSEPTPSCPADGSAIGCEALVACEFKTPTGTGGDTDAFKVTVPANSDLSINIAGPSGSFWTIFAPDGTPVNPAGCGGQCVVALSTAGPYTIQTANSFNLAGAYQLSLLGVSTPFRCGPSLTPGGSPVNGQFNLAGDTDSYQLNVSAGQYSINVAGPSGSFWTIFAPDGTPVNPAGCGGLCQVPLLSAGVYTLRVANSFNLTGSYTLSVQRVGG